MFIIPMAGLSSRFFTEGYKVPKYQLMLGQKTVFSWSVSSFEKYFQTDIFVFIYRDVFDTKNFLEQEIKKIGIKNYELVCLTEETMGQADTVYKGLSKIPYNDELYIFNIDSRLINFTKPDWVDECDAYLEVFQGEGDHWSFALVDDNTKTVKETTEKDRISDLCSDGLYYFKSKPLYIDIFSEALNKNKKHQNEYYIAPLFNEMIARGMTVSYDLVDSSQIQFCGTPDEYKKLLQRL